MPDPQTHYQLSFTSRQAVGLFVGLLFALGLAYFLGLMTGLSGHSSARAVAEPTPTAAPPTPERLASAHRPTPVRPLRTGTALPAFPKPVLGTEPAVSPSLQFFEDRGQAPAAGPTRPPSRLTQGRPPTPASPSGEFWIQVVSVSSQHEARARRDKLVRRGYRARVEPAHGPRGTVYRVRVGPYSGREAAERASQRLSKEEKVGTWIAPAGK